MDNLPLARTPKADDRCTSLNDSVDSYDVRGDSYVSPSPLYWDQIISFFGFYISDCY